MPTLLLLNGPPGVGKSTLAAGWVGQSSAVCLDPDRIRAGYARPTTVEAMLAARAHVLDRASTSLQDGRDVVVPQLCARPEFPDALRELAIRQEATFVEVLLIDSVSHLRRRLHDRASSLEPHQRLAHQALDLGELAATHAALVERAAADPSIEVLRCGEGRRRSRCARSTSCSRPGRERVPRRAGVHLDRTNAPGPV